MGKHHAEAEAGIGESRVIAKEEPPGGSAVRLLKIVAAPASNFPSDRIQWRAGWISYRSVDFCNATRMAAFRPVSGIVTSCANIGATRPMEICAINRKRVMPFIRGLAQHAWNQGERTT
jgi:hypothetical protein